MSSHKTQRLGGGKVKTTTVSNSGVRREKVEQTHALSPSTRLSTKVTKPK